MSLFTKLIKKSVKDFLTKRKKWLIILTLILGLLVGVNLLLNHYVDKVVGTLIKEFVHEKSKGFYKVDFEEIAYILNNGRFFMSEFKFDIHPDHQKNLVYEELKNNYVYTANIPSLHIDIIDFWSIFVNRKLKVIGVEVTSPFIKIINLNKNKTPKKISFEAGNLYSILQGHLNELKINDFLISDGEFDYETYNGPDYDNFKIKGLTFEVNNFRVNEKASARTDKIFYTDDISLEIKDQLLYLKDSIHKVTFDKFYVSTRRNEFGFENFKLSRRDNPHANVKDHDHYEISLPSLRLSGIDFLNAYNNNLLAIDSLEIKDPTINIKKRTIKQQKDSSRSNLLDVAMIYHDYLIIDHFDLDDAQLIFTDETKDLPTQYSIDHISAHLTELELDTGSYSKYQYGLNFDKADLIVKDYEVNLPDSLNTVKFSEFSISSEPFEIKLTDLSINPNTATSNKGEKSQIYASIPYLVITEFDISQAINMDTFLIEEIYLENPEVKIIPPFMKNSKGNGSPGGLFGIYEVIQSISDYFILEKMNMVNGKFDMENSSANEETKLSLNNINLDLKNLKVDSLTDVDKDVLGELILNLSLSNSFLKLPAGSAEVEHLVFNSDNGRLKLDSLSIVMDSVNFKHNARVILPELLLSGINPNEILYEDKIDLDTVLFNDVNIFIDLIADRGQTSDSSKANSLLPPIVINHLIGIDYDFDIRNEGFPLFMADNFKFEITNLSLDQSLSDNPLNQFDYDKINQFEIENYDLYLSNQNHVFLSDRIVWNDNNSSFTMENISLKPYGNPNNKYDIDIPKITMSGINLKKVLKESYYDGQEIVIDRPKFNLKLAQGRQEKMTSLDFGFIPILLRNKYLGVKSNSFYINSAEINLHQKIEGDSLIFEADDLNLFVDRFEVDSTTEMVPNRFLFSNDVQLHGSYLSAYHQLNSDFYNINHYYISTKEGDVKLNGLYYAINTKNEFPDKGQMKLSVDGFSFLGIDFFNLTQNRILEIDEILIDNADLLIVQKEETDVMESIEGDSLSRAMNIFHLDEREDKELPSKIELLEDISKSLRKELKKSKVPSAEKKNKLNLSNNEFLFDTLLLKSIEIDKILLTDSKVDMETTEDQNTGLLIPDIWFLAEGIKYNPISAKDSNRIFYSDNILAKVKNFNYVLSDNLSSIRVDELILNSTDSTIKALNFALIPLVSRYDFGPAKGFQSTWLQIENDSISIKDVDFLGLINNQHLNARILDIHKVDISVFRDKRIEFPEWQRRPLPQTNLRDISTTFAIDTINLFDGFITYQEHSEKAYTTGEVFFSDLNAKIVNLTNDSIRTQSHPNALIGVNTNIFGSGAITGEFIFNLVDMENIHSYGIDVEPFDLTEFNRILIPSASVQISSGESEKIIMTAKANEHYSFGEMKFYYNDLKIQLLNRETETPKGFSNVLGSFFANTFIIKSNNPRNLFLRKGDIFFERDKKRAIFNYWTKTFLSGVISSIGATNNKKKINKMQKENLKRIQEENKDLSTL